MKNSLKSNRKLLLLSLSTKRNYFFFLTIFMLNIVNIASISYADEEFKVNSVIMEINPSESFMVVAEKYISISTESNVSTKTLLLDEKDNKVDLSAFKRGQRVYVAGQKTEKDIIRATVVKMLPGLNELKSLKPIKPIRVE